MTDYEVLGISAHNTDEEIFSAYEKRKKEAKNEKEINRIELAYKRLKSIKVSCPAVTETGEVLTV